jgi:hypothetical protein
MGWTVYSTDSNLRFSVCGSGLSVSGTGRHIFQPSGMVYVDMALLRSNPALNLSAFLCLVSVTQARYILTTNFWMTGNAALSPLSPDGRQQDWKRGGTHAPQQAS